jgi:hypothetical protein
LRRNEALRRIIVIACWMQLGLSVLAMVGNMGQYAARLAGPLWASMLQIVASNLSGSGLLTVAIAIIFARPEVKRAFSIGAAPITQ